MRYNSSCLDRSRWQHNKAPFVKPFNNERHTFVSAVTYLGQRELADLVDAAGATCQSGHCRWHRALRPHSMTCQINEIVL